MLNAVANWQIKKIKMFNGQIYKFLFLAPKLSPKMSGVPSCPRIQELTASLTELILAEELIPDATRFGEFYFSKYQW